MGSSTVVIFLFCWGGYPPKYFGSYLYAPALRCAEGVFLTDSSDVAVEAYVKAGDIGFSSSSSSSSKGLLNIQSVTMLLLPTPRRSAASSTEARSAFDSRLVGATLADSTTGLILGG
jgi:hypothetical protein